MGCSFKGEWMAWAQRWQGGTPRAADLAMQPSGCVAQCATACLDVYEAGRLRDGRPPSVNCAYFCARIQLTSFCASASLTWELAGIGTAPQLPEPPLMIFVANMAAESFWPAYFLAMSL